MRKWFNTEWRKQIDHVLYYQLKHLYIESSTSMQLKQNLHIRYKSFLDLEKLFFRTLESSLSRIHSLMSITFN